MLELDRQYTLDELRQLVSSPPKDLTSAMRQKYREAGIVAQALPHIFHADLPQVVIPDDSHAKAPDALAIFGHWPKQNKVGIEVVQYTPHCEKEGLVKFFGRTKLARTIAYPENTIIVCDVNLPVRDWNKTTEKISSVINQWSHQIPYPVYLLSRHPDQPYLSKLH